MDSEEVQNGQLQANGVVSRIKAAHHLHLITSVCAMIPHKQTNVIPTRRSQGI